MSKGARRGLIVVMIIMTLLLGALSVYLGISVNQGDGETPDSGVSGGSRVCQESCSSDNDCATATTGAETQCLNGKCVNKACPSNTVYGTRCDCNFPQAKCGEKCGYWANGVQCGSGTTCRYVTGPVCAGGVTATTDTGSYCAPTNNPKLTLSKCTQASEPDRFRNQQSYVQVAGQPTNILSLGDARVKQLLCEWCGDGIVQTGEECDAGATNGSQGVTCDASCKTKVITQCNDGADNDGDGKIDCTAGAEDPGCFPNGNGGGGACNPLDNDEKNVTQCSDGIDNDADGKIDCTAGAQDPGCFPDGNGGGGTCNPEDDNEQDNVLPQCSDGKDNDGDAKIDCTVGAEDPGCFPDGSGGGGACDPLDENELDGVKPQCRDGIDNDADGKIDCTVGAEDPGCFPDGNGGGGACNPNDNLELDLLPASGIFSSALGYLTAGAIFLALGVTLYRNSNGKKQRSSEYY